MARWRKPIVLVQVAYFRQLRQKGFNQLPVDILHENLVTMKEYGDVFSVSHTAVNNLKKTQNTNTNTLTKCD